MEKICIFYKESTASCTCTPSDFTPQRLTAARWRNQASPHPRRCCPPPRMSSCSRWLPSASWTSVLPDEKGKWRRFRKWLSVLNRHDSKRLFEAVSHLNFGLAVRVVAVVPLNMFALRKKKEGKMRIHYINFFVVCSVDFVSSPWPATRWSRRALLWNQRRRPPHPHHRC